jgi:hypothetical protein
MRLTKVARGGSFYDCAHASRQRQNEGIEAASTKKGKGKGHGVEEEENSEYKKEGRFMRVGALPGVDRGEALTARIRNFTTWSAMAMQT